MCLQLKAAIVHQPNDFSLAWNLAIFIINENIKIISSDTKIVSSLVKSVLALQTE